jgi:ferredoxin
MTIVGHRVTIDNTGEVYRCAEDVNLLAAAEQALCREIPVGCRNGGCGACKVRITAGSYQTRKMNRAVLSAAEETDGFVLACKTYPRSDVAISVLRLGPARAPQRSFSVKFVWTAPISQPDKET